MSLEKSIERPTYMGGLVKVTDRGVEDVKGAKPMPLNELLKQVALAEGKGVNPGLDAKWRKLRTQG
ncbi:MAG: hypothetical protein QXF24_08720 [Thermoproteota archaeon]